MRSGEESEHAPEKGHFTSGHSDCVRGEGPLTNKGGNGSQYSSKYRGVVKIQLQDSGLTGSYTGINLFPRNFYINSILLR